MLSFHYKDIRGTEDTLEDVSKVDYADPWILVSVDEIVFNINRDNLIWWFIQEDNEG